MKEHSLLSWRSTYIFKCRLTKEAKCPVSDIVRFQVQCSCWCKHPEMCLIRLPDNWKPDVKETFLPDLPDAPLREPHLHHPGLSLLGRKPLHSRRLQWPDGCLPWLPTLTTCTLSDKFLLLLNLDFPYQNPRSLFPLCNLTVVQQQKTAQTWCLQGGTLNKGISDFYTPIVCVYLFQWWYLFLLHVRSCSLWVTSHTPCPFHLYINQR